MQPLIYILFSDLRLNDNPALSAAKATKQPIIFVYIHEDDADSVHFSGSAENMRKRASLISLNQTIKNHFNSSIIFKKGSREAIIKALISSTQANAVYWNRRYLPHQIKIDTALKATLKENNIDAQSFKANLLFEPHEIQNLNGEFYKVYSPFKRACIAKGFDAPPLPQITDLQCYAHNDQLSCLSIDDLYPLSTDSDWDQKLLSHWNFSEEGAEALLDNFIENGIDGYKEKRNFPALEQYTSKLSAYLAQGIISPRSIIYALQDITPSKDLDHFKSEVLWREFSYHLVFHAPYMLKGNFRPEWDDFPWKWENQDQDNFKKWCRGKTGVPIIDSAMQQLWQTGYMHNRCRMIVGSYLVKHLLIDWQHGEQWFKDTLIDYDTANNVAGWQWVSGCGADAAPYFRIFNPILQSKKFDSDAEYIKKYSPKLKNISNDLLHNAAETVTDLVKIYGYYPPLIDHEKGRKRALTAYDYIKKTK